MNPNGVNEKAPAATPESELMLKKKARRTRAKRTSARKGSAMDLVLAFLKRNPKAEFKEVAKAASRRGHKLYPVVYGRAQALLGIVSSRKRRRARGARPAAAASTSIEGLKKFLASYEELRRERDALRAALEEVRGTIGKALR